MARKKGDLNDKQRAFCREYIIDHNATQSALRAGYSERTAYSQGQRLLKNVEIQAEIERYSKKAIKRNDITVDRILQEMARIGFSDIRKVANWGTTGEPSVTPSDDLDDDTAAAITSVKIDNQGGVTLSMAKKEKALEMLGKYAGVFDKDVEADETDTFTINVNLSRKKPTATEVSNIECAGEKH